MAGLKSLNVAFDLITEAVSKLPDRSDLQTLTAYVSPSFMEAGSYHAFIASRKHMCNRLGWRRPGSRGSTLRADHVFHN